MRYTSKFSLALTANRRLKVKRRYFMTFMEPSILRDTAAVYLTPKSAPSSSVRCPLGD